MPIYDVTLSLSALGVTAFNETTMCLAESSITAGDFVLADRIDYYTERDALVYSGSITRVQVLNNYAVYIGTFISTDGTHEYEDVIIAAARNRGDAISLGQTEFAEVFNGRTIITYDVIEYAGPLNIRLETRSGRGR